MYTHSSTEHPLNSDFLDRALRPLQVGERDMRWTEWVRQNDVDIAAYLQECQETWIGTPERSPVDLLRAQWIKWVLTSTVPGIRNQATRALYWYGRGTAHELFKLTVEALSINDPYVYERLLASSYGVALANQHPDRHFAKVLGNYLSGVLSALLTPSATSPTNDQLARLYVQDTIAFAQYFCRDQIPSTLHCYPEASSIPFASAKTINPLRGSDVKRKEVSAHASHGF